MKKLAKYFHISKNVKLLQAVLSIWHKVSQGYLWGADAYCSRFLVFFCLLCEEVGTKITAFYQNKSELICAPIQSLLPHVTSSYLLLLALNNLYKTTFIRAVYSASWGIVVLQQFPEQYIPLFLILDYWNVKHYLEVESWV